jgi:hypothetical protein
VHHIQWFTSSAFAFTFLIKVKKYYKSIPPEKGFSRKNRECRGRSVEFPGKLPSSHIFPVL